MPSLDQLLPYVLRRGRRATDSGACAASRIILVVRLAARVSIRSLTWPSLEHSIILFHAQWCARAHDLLVANLRIQLEVGRLTNMSVAASLASQNHWKWLVKTGEKQNTYHFLCRSWNESHLIDRSGEPVSPLLLARPHSCWSNGHTLAESAELPKRRKQSQTREKPAMWTEESPLLIVHMTEHVQAIERRLQRQMEGEHDFFRSDCLFFATPPLSSLLTGVRHQ